MADPRYVLVVEDDQDLREALRDTLELSQYAVLTANNGEQALALLEQYPISLIVSDVQMPGMDGNQLLRRVKQKFADIPFVLITAYGSVPKAVDAIQEGAADYIIKPFEAEVLIEMANRLSIKRQDTGAMVVHDRRSKEIAELAKRVADSDVTVMISGESGTGKEVYSQLIHEFSPRADQPFVAINCAAIPESMLESILFGYEKGAFTGAYTARAGKFEQANDGTLLLDEISEMDLGLQAKLLRVIQEKEVERLGGNKTIPLNVRIVATTNRNLKEEVLAGRFREDLFYRLNVFPLRLPALRDRPGDILPLAQKFVDGLCPGQLVSIDEDAEKALRAHNWPGNVRELENVVQRAIIMKTDNTITRSCIIFEECMEGSMDSQPLTQALSVPAAATIEEPTVLESDLKSREKQIIIEAIANNRSRKEAAEKLGISPRTLRYKLAQFRKEGLQIPCMPGTAQVS